MKKIILSLGMSLVVSLSFAQSSKRTSAFNYLNYGELDNAKEAIDEAAKHENTINDAKTWYYRGLIYQSIYQSKDAKYTSLDPLSIQKAVESYIKAVELDKKKDFSEDLKTKMKVAQIQLMNEGINAYNKSQFGDALTYFESGYNLSKHPFVAKLDSMAAYNSALVAEKLEKWEIAKTYWEECIRTGYGKGKTYGAYSELLKKLGQNDQALETIRQGRVKYPDDAQLIIAELNFFLQTGKDKEAEQNLNLAIQKDPTNKNLYFALGTISNNLANPGDGKPQPSEADYKTLIEKAEKNYLKALELDPGYFDALYNLGALYFNGAVKITDAAGGIKDNKLFEAEKKRADAEFAKALPLLEKANNMDPNDRNTLISLKALYARTGDNEKYTGVSNKLKSLK